MQRGKLNITFPPSFDDSPEFVQLTPEERKRRPELANVQSLRLFTTKNGVVLTLLTTDKKVFNQARRERWEASAQQEESV